MPFITDKNPDIKDHINDLIANDAVFSARFSSYMDVNRDIGRDGMDGLTDIIVGQQVSTAAAASMRQKFADKFGLSNPTGILSASDDDFRACGLSRQKIGYVRGLAQAILDESIRIKSWDVKSTPDIIAEITSLKGFGLWSAQMYLLFNLCRHDVWPHGDLGIQRGVQFYLGLENRPTEKETLAHGALFKDRESAAALLLWSMKEPVV